LGGIPSPPEDLRQRESFAPLRKRVQRES
jgi:hypothetical protein